MWKSKEELVILKIIDPGRGDASAFCLAAKTAKRLLFEEQKINCLEDIKMMRDIYDVVAHYMGKNKKSVARRIQRTAEQCLNHMDEAQKIKYIGKDGLAGGTPITRDMIFYLAYYRHYGTPYYQPMARNARKQN